MVEQYLITAVSRHQEETIFFFITMLLFSSGLTILYHNSRNLHRLRVHLVFTHLLIVFFIDIYKSNSQSIARLEWLSFIDWLAAVRLEQGRHIMVAIRTRKTPQEIILQ